LRLCLLRIVKKFDSIRTKMTEEIHFEVCPYRHNASTDATPPSTLQALTRCGVPIAQRTTPFAVGKVDYDIGALQRGTFKNSTLGVFTNSECSAFGNSVSRRVLNSELGTTFVGHSELGAFGPWGAIGP